MSAKNNQDFSFEQLLNEEMVQKVDNIDLIEKLGKIKRIEQDKIETTCTSMDRELSRIKKEAASSSTQKEIVDHVSSSFVPLLQPNQTVEYKSPGVQPYLFKKLKRGEYNEADFIDLHGKTIEEAYDIIIKYIAFARRQGYRCVLIIHGKGDREYLKQKATLKSYVAHWLKQMPEVLAYHSAPEWKGGVGALMVILKKDDKASFLNREMHSVRTR